MRERAADVVMPLQRHRLRSRMWGLAVAVLVIVGCGSSQPDSVQWRNIDVPLPDGWFVFEETADRLSIANVDLSSEELRGSPPGDNVVAMFFTYEPDTMPGDWRRLLDDLDADVETDDRLELAGEIPATRLIYQFISADVPTREMVVLVPSRAVVVLAQPVPQPGQQNAPDVFLDHLDTFLQVIDGAEFGRPQLD